MSEWHYLPLGELAAPTKQSIAIGPFGSRMKADCYVTTGIPVIRGTNISNGKTWDGDWVYVSKAFAAKLPNCLVHYGDLVLPHRGSIGEVGLVPDDGQTYLISTSLMKISLDPQKARGDFVFYYLRSDRGRHEILKFASQVGTPGIGQPLTSLRKVIVPVPPLGEQQAIASVLGALDDKIELNRRMNETLEAMARAIFKDWFVDFGPTRAKAALRGHPTEPEYDRQPYLAPNLWSLFPDTLDDDDKPVGWTARRVEDVMELAYGKALKASERTTGSVPVYGSGGITGYHDQHLVNGPSIIVGRKGTVGSLYWEDIPFFPIDTVFYVRPRAPLTFCYCLLQTLGLAGMNTDAAVPGLNRNNVYRLPVAWSCEQLRKTFDEIVKPLRSQIFSNIEESRTLAQTRDLLLPKLMSGEIRVRDAEKAVEAVA